MGSHLHGGLFVSTLTVIVGVGAILTLLTWAARRLIFEAVDLEKANTQLGRYFSPNLVARLVENPSLLQLGGERRELSFVFTDLAGFTVQFGFAIFHISGLLQIGFLFVWRHQLYQSLDRFFIYYISL